MQEVTHGGRTTAYRVADRDAGGATLLCVHGSGADHRLWTAQDRLADRYTVASVALSGHGPSDDIDATPGFETLAAYADDVVATAEAVDADVLVGNSLGGAVVQQILLERDVAPDAVVLSGTGAKLAVLSDLLDWLAEDFERAIDFLHGEDRLFHDPDPGVEEASVAAMRECGRAVTERDFRTCHEFDVRDRVAEISVPTLAAVGEHDRLTPPEYHDYLADTLQDCSVAVVPEAAHLAMIESATAFNGAVDEFLSDRL